MCMKQLTGQMVVPSVVLLKPENGDLGIQVLDQRHLLEY